MVFVTFYPSDLATTGLPMGIGTREAGWKRSGATATGSEKDERKVTDFPQWHNLVEDMHEEIKYSEQYRVPYRVPFKVKVQGF